AAAGGEARRGAALRPPATGGHSAAWAGCGLGVPVAGGGPGRARQLGPAAGGQPPRPDGRDPDRPGDPAAADRAGWRGLGPAAGGDVRQSVRPGPVGAGAPGGRPAGAADPEAAVLPCPDPLSGQGHAGAAARADLPDLGADQPRVPGPRGRDPGSGAWDGAGRGLDRAARPRGPRRPVHGGAGRRRALAEEWADARPALAGLDRGAAAGRPAGGVALVSAAVRNRARLPLLEAGPGLDERASVRPGRGRPLELAAGAGAV